MTHEQQVVQFIGSGYDVFGKYADAQYLKKHLFDTQFAEQYTRTIPDVRIDHYTIDGQNRRQYQESLSIRVAATADYPLFPASVEAGFQLDRSKLDLAENRFMSVNLYKKLEINKLEVSQDKLSEYMLKDAQNDLNLADPDQVIQQYGGYVVGGIVSGGRWTINLLYNGLQHESATKLEVQLKAVAGSFVTGELSAEFEGKLEEEESHLEHHFHVVGGSTDYGLDKMDDWKKSVTVSTAQVTDFTETGGLIPIWDFVSDEDRKRQLKAAYEKHAQEQSKLCPHECELPSVLKTIYITPPLPSSTSEGLGANDILKLYNKPDDQEWCYVGHSGNDNKVLCLRETEAGYGILKTPTKWNLLWQHDEGFFSKTYHTCWIPEAPPGYVALGMFCRFGAKDRDPPSDEEVKNIVVVHKSYTEKHDLNGTEIWTSDGSGADYTVTLGKLRHHSLWPIKNTDPNRQIPGDMWSTLKKLPIVA